jgi:cyclic pyranopterin phosphate synthase
MLTHIDEHHNPTMVDITMKENSVRFAKAQTLVQLPEVFRSYILNNEITLKKGPLFQTAIIAGTQAVKKTFEMIPFCHQIPIEACKFNIEIDQTLLVQIQCEVKTTFKTGVEMEALHGALMAALTIYDMGKALSHEIVILESKLLSKTGGKQTILNRPTFGLVLTGGKSERMGEDKALIHYHHKSQAQVIFDLLKKYCNEVFLSARNDQWKGMELEGLPTISDSLNLQGPMNGILSAMNKFPEVNWIVVACDLIHFNDDVIRSLIDNYQSDKDIICFKNKEKDFPEALCALYTPSSRSKLLKVCDEGITCAVKALRNLDLKLITQSGLIDLSNINTKEEFLKVKNEKH